MSPAILGFKPDDSHHNTSSNDNISGNIASRDALLHTAISSKLWQTRNHNNVDASLQEPVSITAGPPVQSHILRQDLVPKNIPAEKGATVELKITPPFQALRLAPFPSPLRPPSPNARVSMFSRAQSSVETPQTPVLAPSPIITRSTHVDDLLSATVSCNGDYWPDHIGEEQTIIARPSPVRTLWTKRSSELISVPKDVLGPISATPRITISTFLQTPPVMNDTAYQGPAMQQRAGSPQPSIAADLKPRSVSDSIMSFARRSWTSPVPSRSSSPSGRDDGSRDGESTTPASSTPSPSPTITDQNTVKDGAAPEKAPRSSRRNSISSAAAKKPRRPFNIMFLKSAASDPVIPSVGSLGVSHSISADSLHAPVLRPTGKRPKDKLWEAFRVLENDYNKFQSKSSAQKANIIRTSLISFLRNSARVASNDSIEPDELDRRARVLHRWWTGLLAQLQNRSATAIAGTDRPVYLEGISGIMSRPEWRPPHSEFSPISQQLSKSNSSTSLSSDSSRYSVEKSVLHNIKSLFTRTLIDTLAFAVDKMGQRTAPASMVAFAGKVAAYAFYFCGGVAEVLIRLWGIDSAMVRRVVQEVGAGRGTDVRGVSECVLLAFPEYLQPLGFTNLAKTLRHLKTSVKPPPGNTVNWDNDLWKTRWQGRDTDLLFVFLKYYHVLLCDFLPPHSSSAARICAPAFVLVQAHMLSILESMIHKPTKQAPGNGGPISVTFDDVLANASAALPVPTYNAGRTMAENKLVVLLRDVLSDTFLCSSSCRDFVATSFGTLLKAAASRTKIFDADACFTLCDILEEMLPLLDYAEKELNSQGKYIDWTFWLDAFKRMGQCDNNMTELRLICIVYMAWGLFTEDQERKKKLCIDWLLSNPVWEHFFCHWCPMVRAYYMRLICWRLGRYNGGLATDVDNEILQKLSLQLRTAYSHFTRLKENAEHGLNGLPASTPCLPAPGRRLIILRNDTITPPAGSFLSVDGIIPRPPTNSASKVSSQSPLPNVQDDLPKTPVKPSVESLRFADTAETANKRRWNFLRSFGFQHESPSPPNSPDSPVLSTRRTADNLLSGTQQPEATEASHPVQRKAVFKFSLEWMPQQPFNVRDKHLSPARLPAPVQKYIDGLSDENQGLVDISECANLSAGHWTYTGRALAEWVLVVVEYENFFDRRKSEGKESDRDVETPTLGVEPIRRL